MQMTRQEVKECTYNQLSKMFEGYKTGWVYEDFFKDPVEDFKHFADNFDGDQQFMSLSSEFEDQQDFKDYCYDIAVEIASSLKASDFMHSACQMMN